MEIIDLSFINKLTTLPKMELVGLQRLKAKTDHCFLNERGSNAGVSDCNCDCEDYDCNCDCERYDCDCQDCRDCEDCDCKDYDCEDCCDCLNCDCPVDNDCDYSTCVCDQNNCDCPDGDNCYDWDGCSDD